MREPKGKTQKRHAIRRLLERYDIKISDHGYVSLVKDIQQGKARFIGRQSNRVTYFEIPYKYRKLIAVYDRVHKTIVTFLPEGTPDALVGKPDEKERALLQSIR